MEIDRLPAVLENSMNIIKTIVGAVAWPVLLVVAWWRTPKNLNKDGLK